MAIEYDKSGKLFQVDYQSPFGGIDSTAFASALNPANFASMASTYITDNMIEPIDIVAFPGSTNTVTGNFLGFVPFTQTVATQLGFVITDTGIYEVDLAGGNVSVSLVATYTPASVGANSNIFSYLIIDNIQTGVPIIYWTVGGWSEIWQFTSSIITNLTTYVGGGILGLINNQLINLGGISAADGSTPNRISWSAPGEYGQFQPYDIPTATGNYAAGFNDLPSTSDVLTGFAAIGTVGYLFRTQGITQMNPTGNGIEPFQFNHLWASELGIGAPYPNTISQYGSVVAFISDSGIYTLGLGGLSQIGQQAQSYIYGLLNSQAVTGLFARPQYFMQGQIVPYMTTNPGLMYVIGFGVTNNPLNDLEFLAISLDTGNTYNLGLVAQQDNIRGFNLSYYGFGSTGEPFSRQINPLIVVAQLFGGSTIINVSRFVVGSAQTGVFSFRMEQMKFGYLPTVSKIGYLAALIDPTAAGTIASSVDGTFPLSGPFPVITIPAGTANLVFNNYYSDGIQTLQRPQLTVQLKNVQIVEAWYQGTLADYPLI